MTEEEKNEYEQAVGAMEMCCRLCEVSFDLRFRDSDHSSIYTRKWLVKTMGKTFSDRDFITAVRQAVAFVAKAHPEKFEETPTINKE